MSMTASSLIAIETAHGSLTVDTALGNIRGFRLRDGARELHPLHTAHWVEDADVQANDTLLPVEKKLSGDFFCAPFGTCDLVPAPSHGWTANSAWTVSDAQSGQTTMVLDRDVMGARAVKTLRLANDGPLLYQEHLISGGEGGIPVAHHPMVHCASRGRASFSPKRLAISADSPLEAGRNHLACPRSSSDLAAFPTTDGSVTDLGVLPIASAHEDFVTLVEAAGRRLGWTAVLREKEDDIVFFLKDAEVLPVTMLWYSNGGRDHAPWAGRHTGVLGIEDGCTAGAAGHRAAVSDNAVARAGVPSCLTLQAGKTHRIAHVTGAIARPSGWSRIADIDLSGDFLTLTDVSGATRSLTFLRDFFDERL